jgi:flagellar hook-length control protein FliK
VNTAVMLGIKAKKGAPNSKAQGLFPAATAAFRTSSKTARTGSFASAMASKTEEAGPSMEKLQTRLAAALNKLKDTGVAEAGSLEKRLKDILADRALTRKEKAERLKALMSEAQERVARLPAQAANAASPKTAGAGSSRQSEQETSGASAPSVLKQKSAEPSIKVVDLRRNPTGAPDASKDVAGKDSARSIDRDPGAIAADLKAAAVKDGAGAAGKSQEARAPASAQTPLERLREMAGSELVKNAGMILRNGGGEIRLVLKPESLGSVRLRLNLTDNVIDGKIIVDNTAVKHILEASLDSLTRALSAEGFQTASLQVSVSGGGADADGARQDAAPVRRMEAVQGLSGMVPDADALGAWDELLVNLFA